MFDFRKIFVILSVALIAYSPTSAMAQSAIDGGSGLFFVQKAETLGAGAFSAGISYAEFDYEDGPEWHAKSFSPSISVGITDRLDISVYTPWKRLIPKGASGHPSGWADGIARLKYNFYDSEDSGISLSGIALLTLPLGDNDRILGTGETNPGAMFALDKRYEKTTLSVNFGYLSRAEDEYDDQLLYGIGAEHMVTHDLGLIAEWAGYSYTSSSSAKDDNAMALVGARYYLNETVSLQAALGSGTSGNGQYNPNAYGTIGATIIFGGNGRRGAGRTGNAGRADVAPPESEPAVAAAVAPPEEVVLPDSTLPDNVEVPVNTGTTKMDAGFVKVVLESVHFKFDKSALTDRAKEILRANAIKLQNHPGADFIVEGNTCSIGADGYNFKLGQRRARAVKKFLVDEMGVGSDRLELISYGELRPNHTNDTKAGRSMNRRVDFIIKSK